jgi:hypothetical protein
MGIYHHICNIINNNDYDPMVSSMPFPDATFDFVSASDFHQQPRQVLSLAGQQAVHEFSVDLRNDFG